MKEWVIIMADGETVRLKASSMIEAVRVLPHDLSVKDVAAVMRVEDYEALDSYKISQV